MMTTTFVMDAGNILFSNRKRNPARPWFYRMICELEHRRQEDNVQIVMHSNLWKRIAYLYSFDGYIYKRRWVYCTSYSENQQNRYAEYLARRALPIGVRMYPIVLDDQADVKTVRFVRNGEVLGRINNIRTRTYKPRRKGEK